MAQALGGLVYSRLGGHLELGWPGHGGLNELQFMYLAEALDPSCSSVVLNMWISAHGGQLSQHLHCDPVER